MPRTKNDYRELLKRYETAIHATGNLLYDWDCRTNEVSYGGNLKDILGYTFKEMEGGLARWGELIHPDDKPYFDETIKKLLETRELAHRRCQL